MQLKLKDIIVSLKALDKFYQDGVPINVALKLSCVKEKMIKYVEDFDKNKNEKIFKYGIDDDKGNKIVLETSPHFQELKKEIEQALETEFDIPLTKKIPVSLLKDKQVKEDCLTPLLWLFEDDL